MSKQSLNDLIEFIRLNEWAYSPTNLAALRRGRLNGLADFLGGLRNIYMVAILSSDQPDSPEDAPGEVEAPSLASTPNPPVITPPAPVAAKPKIPAPITKEQEVKG